MQSYAIYGITLETDLVFRWPLPTSTSAPDVDFTCTREAPIAVDWDAAPPIFATPRGHTDEAGITFHRLPGVDVIRFGGNADHYLWPERIVCHLPDLSLAWLAEIQLLGMVLGLWLERRGTITLHASANVIAGNGVAFLGTKGGGKTTIATALTAAEHPLLVDDLLALDTTGHQVLAQPGYPLLRLWPEQADHFIGHHESLPLVHDGFTKRRASVGQHLGSFHADAVPLRRIYLPDRTDGGALAIEPVTSRDALIATVRHAFLPEAVHAYGLAAMRLKTFAEVLRTVGVRRLTYPNGFERLPEVVAAIEQDISAD